MAFFELELNVNSILPKIKKEREKLIN
jgi:hypothetical protein